MHRSRAFTLVEILIVVVILGVLASIVAAQFTGATRTSRQGAFLTNLQTFVKQAEIYQARSGQYPDDASSGELPLAFVGLIHPADWENGTPIGGVWDAELDEHGIASAIGVHFNGQGLTRDDAYMSEVDALFDDGDVGAGLFRRIAADRYYYVIAE